MQRVRGCSGIADARRDLHSLSAQDISRVHRRLVALRAGQPGKEADPKLAVVLREESQCLPEQRDDLRIRAGAHPHESAAVSEGSASELLRVRRLSRHVGGREERCLCRGHVASFAQRVSECEQEVGPFFIGRRRGSGGARKRL